MTNTNRAVATRAPDGDLTVLGVEAALIQGDLSALTPRQRIDYYTATCESLGLNRLTKPFQYISVQAGLILYCTKGGTEQLRAIHHVSIVRLEREMVGDLYIVTAYARLPDGREDSEIGAVSVKGLSGDPLANAMMRASTKAKRRVTLAICGLGMLDESEVESIPGSVRVDVDQETGEIRGPVALPAPVDDDDLGRRAFFARARELGYPNKRAIHHALRLDHRDGALGEWVASPGGSWAAARSKLELAGPYIEGDASDLYQHDPDPVATARNQAAAQQRTMRAEGPAAADLGGDPPAAPPAEEPDDPAYLGVCSEEGCNAPAEGFGPNAEPRCEAHLRGEEQAEPDPPSPCPPTVNDLGSFLDAIEALGADRSDLPALGPLPKRGAAHEEWVAVWDVLAARKRTPQRAMPLGEA